MAPRKKAEQLGLGEVPVKSQVQDSRLKVEGSGEVPCWVEYPNGAETWCCKKFDLMVAELPGVTVADLPRLHAALEVQSRQWLIARRVFGMMPVSPSPRVGLDDLRTWLPAELVTLLGLKNDQWQQELSAIRGIWAALRPAPTSAPVETSAPAPRGLFADEDFIKTFDLGRVRLKDMDEKIWFVARVKQLEKLFRETMTSGLTRNLLMTELQLRRVDENLSFSDMLGEEWRKNMKLRGDLDSTYNDQLSKIDKLAPWASMIAGKYSFKGALTEVTKAIQEYYANNNHLLVDGIFTAAEVQVECRMSVQAPEPRYRLGWVTHALEAKANLWNPKWKSATPLTIFKKLDSAMKTAIKQAGQEMGELVPDLEKDGPEGEYAPLQVMPV